VDETSLDRYYFREHAWCAKNEFPIGFVSGKRFERQNILAGRIESQLVAPLMYKGYTDTILFLDWIKNHLLPVVPKGSVIVMDNASFHKNKAIREAIETADCELLYLPPYSPDLNPIEKSWALLKRHLKSFSSQFIDFIDAVSHAFNSLFNRLHSHSV